MSEEITQTERLIIKFLQKRGGFTPLISIKRNFFLNDFQAFSKVIKDMKRKGIIEVRPYGEFGWLNAFLTEKYR